jgi:hypothetical protein
MPRSAWPGRTQPCRGRFKISTLLLRSLVLCRRDRESNGGRGEEGDSVASWATGGIDNLPRAHQHAARYSRLYGPKGSGNIAEKREQV